MAILQCQFTPFCIPFHKPISINGQPLHNREGLYVSLIQDQTIIGIGEIAPLPYLSSESFNAVVEQCNQLKTINLNLDHSLEDYLSTGFPVFSQLTSIQFGLESACLMALCPTLTQHCKSHHFVTDLSNSLPKQPISSLKCKVGLQDPKKELEFLNIYLNHFPSIKLRLDANQRFNLEQAYTFFTSLPPGRIDYIEDPCPLTDQTTFAAETQLPLALDCPALENYPFPVKTIVIKPTIIGSIATIQAYTSQFPNTTIVYSSCFETPVGIGALTRLAALTQPTQIHGFNTLQYLKLQPAYHQQSIQTSLTLNQAQSWLNNN